MAILAGVSIIPHLFTAGQSRTTFITYVSIQPTPVNMDSSSDRPTRVDSTQRIDFAARFACRGKTTCRPALVELRFISTSQNWVLKEAPHTLRVFIDNKLFSYGGYAWSGERLSADEVGEIAEIRVRPPSLESVAKGRVIKIELDGDCIFYLSSRNLSDVQELVAKMTSADPQAQ